MVFIAPHLPQIMAMRAPGLIASAAAMVVTGSQRVTLGSGPPQPRGVVTMIMRAAIKAPKKSFRFMDVGLGVSFLMMSGNMRPGSPITCAVPTSALPR